MRYIKKFNESQYTNNNEMPKNSKFKIGDFVIVNVEDEKIVYKVIGYNKLTTNRSNYRLQEINTDYKAVILWSPKNLRKATTEEVKEFELKQALNKYNI